MLKGKCVVLGVTGGIAAYKSAELCSRLKKLHADVRVVMTENATRFIAPLTFESLSGNQVHVSTFEKEWEIEHIALAKAADLFVIAPCTANVIGKLACGIADDLLTTTTMAATCPVLIAPAMNANMYRSAANTENLATLKRRGFLFVGPETGFLACGDEDIGRMSEPVAIVEEAVRILCPKRDLSGVRVLVTAGPTREAIDPVRFLSNRSTGKMGYAIAEAAQKRGAKVTLVSGPTSLSAPAGVERVNIQTTQELYDEVTRRAREADVVIQAAAPADFRPARTAEQKIKKTDGGMTLALESTPDIARQLGRDKREGQILVAFAAETERLVENARGKLERKNADLVVANDVTEPGAGFAVSTNRVTIVSREGEKSYPQMSKLEVADVILDHVSALVRHE